VQAHRAGLLVLAIAALAACGGDDGFSPQDLAGIWSGTTSQGRAFSFTVSNQGITSLSLNFQHTGPGCSYTADVTTSGPAVPISNGQFNAANVPLGIDTEMDASGSFTSASAASGNASIADFDCGGTTNLTWSATKQ
jgi:hypothetical protein